METRSSIKNILREKLMTKIALHYKTFIGGGMFSRISYVGMVEIFVNRMMKTYQLLLT